MLDVPQLQFVFRGWDFPAATQGQVSTVHTPRSGAALGTVPCLLSSGGEPAAEGGWWRQAASSAFSPG